MSGIQPRLPVSLGRVFAFEWCGCIYESGYSIVSLHASKKGAFKAMTQAANRRWQEDRDNSLVYGTDVSCWPLRFEAWRVREIEVLP